MFYFALMIAVTVNMDDEAIDKSLSKIISVSAIIFGPVLSLVAAHGWWNIKAVVKVCKITGYETDTINYPSIFLLVLFSSIGFGIFATMVYDRTTEVQTTLFTENNSIFFTIISIYFRYNNSLRERK